MENSTREAEAKCILAEQTAQKWRIKFKQVKKEVNESRDVIVLYEGLMDKLTEQNTSLKAVVAKSNCTQVDVGTSTIKNPTNENFHYGEQAHSMFDQ